MKKTAENSCNQKNKGGNGYRPFPKSSMPKKIKEQQLEDDYSDEAFSIKNKNTFYTSDGRKVIVEDVSMGVGQEGGVYGIRFVEKEKREVKYASHQLNLGVAKIYKNELGTEHENKLNYILEAFDNMRKNYLNKRLLTVHSGIRSDRRFAKISNPLILLYDENPLRFPHMARLRGFIMRKFNGLELTTMLMPEARRRNKWNRLDLCNLAMELLYVIEILHENGILVGDIRTDNILVVDGQTDRIEFKLIDVDSCQVGFSDGQVWHGPLPGFAGCTFDPEYTSSALILKDFSLGQTMRMLDDELYAVSVLVFKILMCTASPYACQDNLNTEQRMTNRHFFFTEGYTDNPLRPKGVYFAWWSCLSHQIQSMFRRVFEKHEVISIDEWLLALNNYFNQLKNGSLPRGIDESKQGYILDRKTVLMSVGNSDCKNSIGFWDIPSFSFGDNGTVESKTFVLLVFGTNRLSAYYYNSLPSKMNTRPKETILWSGNHFEFIDHDGYLDVHQLEYALEDTKPGYGMSFRRWIDGIKGEKPYITNFYAVTGSPLRCIKNGNEINEFFQEHYGIKFHVFSPEDEARLILQTCCSNHNIPTGTAILNITGLSTSLIVYEGNRFIKVIPADMGGRILRNWLLSTIHHWTPMDHALRIHEKALTGKCSVFDDVIDGIKELVVCGIKDMGLSTLSLHELELQIEKYEFALCENRTFLKDLPDDLENCLHTLPDRLDAYLRFPMVKYIAEKAGLDKIRFVNYGAEYGFLYNKIFNVYPPRLKYQSIIKDLWSRLSLNKGSLFQRYCILEETWVEVARQVAKDFPLERDQPQPLFWIIAINKGLMLPKQMKSLSIQINTHIVAFRIWKRQNTLPAGEISCEVLQSAGFSEEEFEDTLNKVALYWSEISKLPILE